MSTIHDRLTLPGATLRSISSSRRQPHLQRRILEEVPRLRERLDAAEGYAAAKLLLDWASPRTPWAARGDSLIRTGGRSASLLLARHFDGGRAGVYCSGAADFLHKVLDVFAIENFVIDYGTTRGFLTHAAVVIVVRAPPGVVRFHLLDPTFNMHFSDRATGAPLTVDSLLESEREGRLDGVQAHPGSISERMVVDRSSVGAGRTLRCREAEGACTGCSLDTYLSVWAPVLRRNGFPTGMAGLVSLLGAGELFRPRRLGVPRAFRRMHAEAVALRSSIRPVSPSA